MKIIQITDSHLRSTPGATIHGYNTYEGLTSVIDVIIDHHNFACEALLVTGDISDDGSHASYRLALQQMKRLSLPIYYLGGNHDNAINLAAVFGAEKNVGKIEALLCDDWQFICVDTVQNNQDSGFLSAQAQETLRRQIAGGEKNNIALFMHHHPVAVGIPLVDDCMLLNGEDIIALCQAHDEIKALCCGHAHTEYQEIQNNCMISVCPATSFQWQDGARTLLTENKRGFNILEFGATYQATTFFI
ncbi:metallophosphoesterase [Sodalis sp. C49]|uniref:metallophosphoesterase n=1 Tax=unclassified Sodalis (in: enterobacteria) TaxID=2636512 RepID=UPI0039658EE4